MKIYAVVGTGQQTIVSDSVQYSPQENEVMMTAERPEGDYIATKDGEWVIDKTPAIEALTAEYRAEKENLCEAYTTATMQGDTETAQSVAADMTDLDAWFDEEYQKIKDEGSEDNG